jgi:hypothetical protein
METESMEEQFKDGTAVPVAKWRFVVRRLLSPIGAVQGPILNRLAEVARLDVFRGIQIRAFARHL